MNQKYVSIQAAHRYLTEYEGLKLSVNGVYEKCRTGEIRALMLSGKWHIPASELLDYPSRVLSEAKGIPTAHSGLLGTLKHK